MFSFTREREGTGDWAEIRVPVLGNILEEKQAPAKFSSRRSASPADEKGRVICHTPTNNGLEEETSSDDTGGQV